MFYFSFVKFVVFRILEKKMEVHFIIVEIQVQVIIVEIYVQNNSQNGNMCLFNSLFYLHNFSQFTKKNVFTQNTSHCYNSHSLFTVLYSALSFSYVPLSVTELITKVIGDQFQRQHKSKKSSQWFPSGHSYISSVRKIFPWAQ